MALVVHPPPVDGPRRSPRIRVRRQTNLSRSSCLLAHTQTAVSRRTLPRSTRAADLSIHPNPSAIVASLATHAKSSIRAASSLPPASASKRRTRASTGSSSTAPSSSRNRRPAARKHQIPVVVPHPSSSVPILAGSKRKRSQNAADRPDPAAYELVPVPVDGGVLPVAAAGDKTADEDEEFQTPRQLRYAKRQRLLTSLSDNETPATRADVGRLRDGSGSRGAPSGDAPQPQGSAAIAMAMGKAGEPRVERSGPRERGAHRATTVSDPACSVPSLCPQQTSFIHFIRTGVFSSPSAPLRLPAHPLRSFRRIHLRKSGRALNVRPHPIRRHPRAQCLMSLLRPLPMFHHLFPRPRFLRSHVRSPRSRILQRRNPRNQPFSRSIVSSSLRVNADPRRPIPVCGSSPARNASSSCECSLSSFRRITVALLRTYLRQQRLPFLHPPSVVFFFFSSC